MNQMFIVPPHITIPHKHLQGPNLQGSIRSLHDHWRTSFSASHIYSQNLYTVLGVNFEDPGKQHGTIQMQGK